MENRKDKRFGERDNVLIKHTGKAPEIGASGVTNAYTRDISMTGAQIRTKLDLPVGSVIRIVIDLKRTRQSLSVDGEVIWTRKSEKGRQFDIGIKFLHCVPDTILLLITNFYGKQVEIPSQVS